MWWDWNFEVVEMAVVQSEPYAYNKYEVVGHKASHAPPSHFRSANFMPTHTNAETGFRRLVLIPYR